jgi:hypothetical protein
MRACRNENSWLPANVERGRSKMTSRAASRSKAGPRADPGMEVASRATASSQNTRPTTAAQPMTPRSCRPSESSRAWSRPRRVVGTRTWRTASALTRQRSPPVSTTPSSMSHLTSSST